MIPLLGARRSPVDTRDYLAAAAVAAATTATATGAASGVTADGESTP